MCSGCVCGGKPSGNFAMDGLIAVGFGMASVTKDGATVYDEMETEHAWKAEDHPEGEWPPFWTGQDAENAALADPDHDWRIAIWGPMSGGEWQRKSPGVWECIASNAGFA